MRKGAPFILILIFFLLVATFAEGRVSSSFEMNSGLYVIAFDVPQGKIMVNLPDVICAGDSISGTVIAEPRGQDQEELHRNADELNRYLIGIGNDRTSVVERVIKWTVPAILSHKPANLVLRDKNGEEVARTQIPLQIPPNVEKPAISSPESYQFPVIGQAGKPISITGPFDGNFDTTVIKIAGREARLIAESPRKLVFESSKEVVGPTEIELKEGNLITKRKFNNLRVVKINQEGASPIPPPLFTPEPTKLRSKEEGTTEEQFLVEQTPAAIKQLEEKTKSGEIEEQISTPYPISRSIKTVETRRAEETPTPIEGTEKKSELKTATTEKEKNPLPSPTPLSEKQVKTGNNEKKEATKANTETIAPTETGGEYTIQIGSFKTEEEAKEIAESLISKGYPAFVTTGQIPGKGTWYRVRIGTFKTIKEARIYWYNLKSLEPSIKSVFITVNN